MRGGAFCRIQEMYFDSGAIASVKEMTGLTRKHLIPLFEYFDLTKVTLRVGDKRVLRKAK